MNNERLQIGYLEVQNRPTVNGTGVLLSGEGQFRLICSEIGENYQVRQDYNRLYQTIDRVSPNVHLARGHFGIIYNRLYQTEGTQNPSYTEWNADGWNNLSNIQSRVYLNLIDIIDSFGGDPNSIRNKQLVMRDTSTDKYYKIFFSAWENDNIINQYYKQYFYTRTEYKCRYEVSNNLNFNNIPTVNGTGITIGNHGTSHGTSLNMFGQYQTESLNIFDTKDPILIDGVSFSLYGNGWGVYLRMPEYEDDYTLNGKPTYYRVGSRGKSDRIWYDTGTYNNWVQGGYPSVAHVAVPYPNAQHDTNYPWQVDADLWSGTYDGTLWDAYVDQTDLSTTLKYIAYNGFASSPVTLASLAGSNRIVYNTGDQTIGGEKTFSSRPTVNGIDILLSGEIPIITLPESLVYTSGDQNISGNKSFLVYPNKSFWIDNKNKNSSAGWLYIDEYSSSIGYDGNSIYMDYYGTSVSGPIAFNNNVDINSNLAVNGNMSFTSRPTVNGKGVLLSGEAASLPTTIVYTTGNQTVSGTKTFASRPTVNGTGIVLSGDANIVYTAGDQDINGIKRFAQIGMIPSNGFNETINIASADNQDGTDYLTFRDNNDTEIININTDGVSIARTTYFASTPNVNGVNVLLTNQIQNFPTTVVYTSGNQTISGNKSFLGDTYIKNLFVTGTQTIVNTTNTNVASNYVLLNATGGARDAGIFIVTGLSSGTSGTALTGANDIGAIIGYDVPANQWVFGNASRNSDLSTLDKIASVSQINTLSGYVTGITGTFGASVNALNTYAVLTTGNQSISGVKTFASRPTVNGTGVLLSGEAASLPTTIVYTTGNQTVSGTKSFSGVVNINSGTFLTRPTVNGTGVLLSGEAASLPTTIVYTTGNQAISGNKDFYGDEIVFSGLNVIFADNTGVSYGKWQFSNRPTVNGTGVLLRGEAASLPTTIVYTTGNQTISGIKTFVDNTAFLSGINIGGVGQTIPPVIKMYDNPNSTYGELTWEDNILTFRNYPDGGGNQGGNAQLTFNFRAIESNGIRTIALDERVVHNFGDETISGIKTFTSRPTVNGTGVLLSGEAASLPTTIVYTTGNQTISGIKTFTTGIDIVNGINAQSLRVFNATGTNSGEFGVFGWQATGTGSAPNALVIGARATQSGTLRNVILTGANIYINTSGTTTFSSRPTVNETGVLLSGEAVSVQTFTNYSGFINTNLQKLQIALPTGIEMYTGTFNTVFSATPTVVATIMATGLFNYITALVSATKSGFVTDFSDVIEESGVTLNIIAYNNF